MRYGFYFALLSFFSIAAFADVVNVYEVTECGGATVQISERMIETGWNCTTLTAPAKSGYIFTHWEISTAQAFENRDEWGRALDQVSFVVYEDTTLTACYVPKTLDEDGDGVADGHELYWYGDLSQGPNSDTDDDGVSFAAELAAGRNPLMAETADAGPIVWVSGAEWLFNPNDYGAVTIRSEPEGLLFATSSEVYRPGTRVSTTSKGTYRPETTTFAYWSFNGERLADEWGRAEAEKTVVTDGSPLTIVAYAASDYETRMKLYWYGTTDVAMTSDTDGDGKTFAEELAAGSNPLMAETKDEGPVRTTDGVLWQYNPYNYQPYTMKSDPEGALFPTESYYVRAGTKVVVSAPGSSFYGWQVNGGEIRRDEWGRSEDAFTFTMPGEAVTLVAKTASDYETRMKLYWYGTTDIAMTSDTDGDGVSFADELVRGTNPLMAETKDEGPVAFTDTETKEFNLQPYEQVMGAVVDEIYEEFPTFGGAVTPTVADVDGDGKLDIVVEVAGGETVVYLGCGGEGNPEFKEAAWQTAWAPALAAAKPRSLEGLEFDVKPPADALSWSFADVDGDGVEDLLVSDSEGRIWYYRGVKDGNDGKDEKDESSESFSSLSSFKSFVLQHKVWGGTHAGFAQGLRIAAVDWDDDGDLDCLCGTAEGKLMLLRDPRVGRPTNLKALVGVDNVKLDWDPNQQSRIRGYRVYRAGAKDENDGNDEKDWSLLSLPSFESLGLTTTLPTYRDYPPSVSDFDYKVSSVSRHYVAGNSTPIESESPTTEAVRASLGKVSLHWNDVVAKRGETFSLMLSIDNSANLSPEGMAIEIEYDHAVLNLLKTLPSGLFEQGKIVPGSGKLYEYVFEVVTGPERFDGEGAVETTVVVKSATMYALGGAKVVVGLPEKNATITIAARSESAPYQLGDVNGDGVVDTLDVRLLAQLKSAAGRKWTANQLKAGDFNGNGKLDNADYQALRELLKEKDIL